MVAERWLISLAAPVKVCRRLSACSLSYASAALLRSSVSFVIARTKNLYPCRLEVSYPVCLFYSPLPILPHRGANGKNRRKRVMLSGSEASGRPQRGYLRCFAAAQHDTFASVLSQLWLALRYER